MKIEHFGELLAGNNGVRISKDLVIYNDFELYNYSTGESKCYTNLDDLVNANPDVKKIIEETEAFELDWRKEGAKSSNQTMGGGFGHAGGGGGAGDKDIKTLHPAELNLGNAKGASVDQTVEKFEAKYGDAKIEYGVTIDEQGFATQHKQGQAHSVGIWGGKGETLIHNHPSGSNFSDSDLHNFANTPIKSLIATSSSKTTKGRYTITKTDKFKAKEFDKAISKAKWPTHMDYNTGASWWLKKNQKTYGYTFSQKGVKIGDEWKPKK